MAEYPGDHTIGPVYVEVLHPPPVVAQIGATVAGGTVAISQLFKTLLDVDEPAGGWGLGINGYVPQFVGATQHLQMVDVGALLSSQSLGQHTNTLPSVDTAANNDFLVYNGTDWRNMTLAAVQALMGAGFTVAGTPVPGYVVTSVAGVPTWQAAGAGFTVSGPATNGYIVRSVAGTPTWVAYPGLIVSGTIGVGKVVGESGGVPTWVSAGSSTGQSKLAALFTGTTVTYDNFGVGVVAKIDNSTGANVPYFAVPSGYTKARVSIRYRVSGGFGSAAIVTAAAGSTVNTTAVAILSYGVDTADDTSTYTTPVFSVTAGQLIYAALGTAPNNSNPVTGVTAANQLVPRTMDLELFV